MGMEQYTNYCTVEQTKRAYKLGAKLDYCPSRSLGSDNMVYIEQKNEDDEPYYITPTTQQMIGWLRDEDLYIEIGVEWAPTKHFCAYLDKHNLDDTIIGTFDTYEQAELAAIDAALDYLEKGETK